MRVFKKGNWDVAECKPCPICGTKKEGEVALIPILGSNEDDSMTYEALQVHLECLDLMIMLSPAKDKEPKIATIYQQFEEKG